MRRTDIVSWLFAVCMFGGLLAGTSAQADLLDDDDDKKASLPSGSATGPATGSGVGSGVGPTSGVGRGSDSGAIPVTAAGSGAKPVKTGKGNKGAGKKGASLPKDDGESPHKGARTVLLPKGGGGKKKDPAVKPDAEQPVQFESKGLKGLRDKGFLELVDDVVVKQGTMRLEAKHATISFDEATKEVVRVVAEGSVKMFKTDEDSGEKIKAYGDTVVFLNRERTTTLDGNARLWRGADLVRGTKIVYDMKSGLIKGEHVAGEVHPQEQSADGGSSTQNSSGSEASGDSSGSADGGPRPSGSGSSSSDANVPGPSP